MYQLDGSGLFHLGLCDGCRALFLRCLHTCTGVFLVVIRCVSG
ncbi:hypothetical protein XCR_3357 [Xanthomonas campestris pv. raphani 756C]|nr:hypothetical protein XCR_3357 [Xanthomonas campestris pv. raphani 756C]